mgnify:CR=1 FL=1
MECVRSSGFDVPEETRMLFYIHHPTSLSRLGRYDLNMVVEHPTFPNLESTVGYAIRAISSGEELMGIIPQIHTDLF